MKKLFTIEKHGIMAVVEEGRVYGVFDWVEKKWLFFDASGNLLPQYKRKSLEERECDYTDDPTQITCAVNGFYGYTTHEVEYHPGEMKGCFGIKTEKGEKITEEIFSQVDYFEYGLCSVCNEDGKWGCIDETGAVVTPFLFDEPVQFNQYGVAVGNNSLIDRDGEEIGGTRLNLVEDCDRYSRYFCFGLLSEEQSEAVDKCGKAENIRVNIYDTKLREYVLSDIPADKLSVSAFDGEKDVILAAAELLADFEEIQLKAKGTILAKEGKKVTVFDYYQSEK